MDVILTNLDDIGPALREHRPNFIVLGLQDLSQGSVAQVLQLAGNDTVSCVVWMEPVEAQIALGPRILVTVRPVEGQIDLRVGYVLGAGGGGDVAVDLVDV